MKVKPGNENKYLEVQKSWKKLHELRLKTGNILTWALYRPMFTGLDYQWQYVTVTLYKDIAAYKNAHWSDSLGNLAYPNFTAKDWDDFSTKTGEARVLSEVLVYNLLVEAKTKALKPAKYLQLTNMYVKPGNEGAYENLEKNIFKPLHEEAIKTGQMEDGVNGPEIILMINTLR